MKTRLKVKTYAVTLALSLFVPTVVFAKGGLDTSGGGHGIELNNTIEVLDLWEAGLGQTAWTGTSRDLAFESALSSRSPELSPVAQLVGSKISDIQAKDPVLAVAIKKAIQLYQWKFSEKPLKLVTPPDFAFEAKVVQLAIRKGYAIYIDHAKWNRLTSTHQSALVLHEAILALVDEKFPESRGRQLVSLTYGEKFKTLSSGEFTNYTVGMLPSMSDLTDVNHSCWEIYPGGYCARLQAGEAAPLLIDTTSGLMTPYFTFVQRESGAGIQAQSWFAPLRGERYFCEALSEYERSDLRALQLDLHFIMPKKSGAKLPSKLAWRYQTQTLLTKGAYSYANVEACVSDLLASKAIKQIQAMSNF